MRTALLVSAAVLVAGVAFADEEVTHAFSTSVARGGIRRVIVDIPAGEVRLRNSTSDRIAISGSTSRRATASSRSKATSETSMPIFARAKSTCAFRERQCTS